MKIDKDTNILIVGLGMIGGSYAKGFAKKGILADAIDIDEDTIRYAEEHHIIRRGITTADPKLIGEADVIISGLYPSTFKKWMREKQWFFKSGAIITDVTGVKGCLVREIQDFLREDCEFIAAHPMAGCERLGIEHSDETIFYQANYVMVPTEKNTENAKELCRQIGEILGFARISEVSPEEHDELIGFVSQLTHCIAMCLMTCNHNEKLEDYTGDSFRDLTRIARIDDRMWSELFLLNKDALLHQMKLFTIEVSKLERMLMEGDAEGIRDMMRKSTARRKLFDKEKPESAPEASDEALAETADTKEAPDAEK